MIPGVSCRARRARPSWEISSSPRSTNLVLATPVPPGTVYLEDSHPLPKCQAHNAVWMFCICLLS